MYTCAGHGSSIRWCLFAPLFLSTWLQLGLLHVQLSGYEKAAFVFTGAVVQSRSLSATSRKIPAVAQFVLDWHILGSLFLGPRQSNHLLQCTPLPYMRTLTIPKAAVRDRPATAGRSHQMVAEKRVLATGRNVDKRPALGDIRCCGAANAIDSLENASTRSLIIRYDAADKSTLVRGRASMRHDLRREPYVVMPHVRFGAAAWVQYASIFHRPSYSKIFHADR